MYELQDIVEDRIASHHMSNIVPVDITEDIAMKTARLTANEHVVTNVTGYSGDPRRTGTLLFNLQFDDQDTVYPTLFLNAFVWCNLTLVLGVTILGALFNTLIIDSSSK